MVTDRATANTGLRQRLVTSVSRLVMVMIATILGAVVYTSQHTVSKQIHEQLQVGLRVFEKLIDLREGTLLSSAEILTSDFGFRQAVATKDKETIRSVLDNHATRIHADLMVLLDFDGSILQATSNTQNLAALNFQDAQHRELIEAIVSNGAASMFDVIDGRLFQLIAVTVNAPQPIAIAVIGFEMNNALAEELRSLTGLHISFTVDDANSISVAASTLPMAHDEAIRQFEHPVTHWLRVPFSGGTSFVSNHELLQQVNGKKIRVYVSTSLRDANLAFDQLQVEITLIAFLSLFAAIGVSMLMANRIAQPIKQLAASARELAQGNYGLPIQVNTDTREIENLANAFSVMDQEIQQRETEILYQARHDSLTGMFNSNHMFELIREKTLDTRQPFYLALVNIKDFRTINDTFGRDTGDQCLHEVAQRITREMSPQSLSARISADFLIACHGTFDASQQDIIQRMYESLTHSYTINGVYKHLAFSIGVVEFPAQGTDLETLWRRLNLAMDDARRVVKAFSNYRDGQDEQHLRRLRLLADLRTALADPQAQQLTLYYQPKLHLKQGTVTHAEALIRWKHPTDGFIRPDDFIPLAEKTGLINELTYWVINTAAYQTRLWRDQGLHICIAVNLCGNDLVNPAFKSRLNEIIERHGVDPDALSFEITESAIINEPAAAIELLQKLRDRGYSIAVDDFGTGYSSLAQLKQLPVNELKIDKSFVLKLDQSKDDRVIVSTTIHMAHDLGLHVVAEGVESAQAQSILHEMDCDYIQGYFLSKPVPAGDFVEWMRRHAASAAT